MLPAIHRCPAFSLPPAVDPLPHEGVGTGGGGAGVGESVKRRGNPPHRRDGGRRPLLRVGCKGVAGRVDDGSRTHGSQGVPRQWPVAPLERGHPALVISRQGDRSSQYPDNASFIASARTHATYPGWGRQGVVGVSPMGTEPPRERAFPPSAAIRWEQGHPALVPMLPRTSISHPAHQPFACVFLPFGRAPLYLIFGIFPGPLM